MMQKQEIVVFLGGTEGEMQKKGEPTGLAERDYRNQVVSISNSVIRSREYTNLLESKIEVLAVHHMDTDLKQREKRDHEGTRYKVNYVEVKASEIKKLMGRSDGNTYEEIRRAAVSLKEKIYIMEDREANKFVLRSMYGDISYDGGLLSIEFAPGMERYFLNLKSNFTRLRLPILFSFKKNGGFQLYKLIKSYAYPPNLEPIDMSIPQEELPFMELSWSLTDLRMMMGYVDITQDALKREGVKSVPNWEKMAREEKKPQYARWSDFSRRVIEPGIEEINRLSDIYICGVEKKLAGQGGKVKEIVFQVQHNRAYYEKNAPEQARQTLPVRELTQDELDEFIDGMWEFMGDSGLKLKDMKAIAKESGYDMELVRKEYGISRGQDVENLAAWMISAVKNRYEEPVRSKKERKKNFEFERDYDFAELEERLLKRKPPSRRRAAV